MTEEQILVLLNTELAESESYLLQKDIDKAFQEGWSSCLKYLIRKVKND